MTRSHAAIAILLVGIITSPGSATADAEALEVIQLPESPSEAEVERYLARVFEVAKGVDGVEKDSPVVTKLAAIPPEFLPLLLTARDRAYRDMWAVRRQSEHLPHRRVLDHADAVLERHAPRFKAQIITAIPEHLYLLETVEREGWYGDAHPEIVLVLTDDPLVRNPRLVDTLARSKAPGLFGPLVARLYAGPYPNMTLELLYTHFPDRFEDVRTMVGPLRRWDGPRKISARNLIRFGVPGELDNFLDRTRRLVEQYEDVPQAERDLEKAYRQLAETALPFVEYDGEPEDVIAWYDAHRDAIEFDVESRSYRRTK